jgi:hypothetical protein
MIADPTPITSVAGTFCPNAGEYQPSTGSFATRINDQPSGYGRVIVASPAPSPTVRPPQKATNDTGRRFDGVKSSPRRYHTHAVVDPLI